MDEILVIDASSLINFNKFYIFDKYEKGKVYSKLFNFILEKIKNEKIIVIDKAYEEISMNNYVRELKQAIKDYQKETLYLFSEVQRLIQENKRDEIIRMYSEEAVDSELEEYENKHADLYLIAYCIKLKKEGKTPILITEETLGDDKKIISLHFAPFKAFFIVK